MKKWEGRNKFKTETEGLKNKGNDYKKGIKARKRKIRRGKKTDELRTNGKMTKKRKKLKGLQIVGRKKNLRKRNSIQRKGKETETYTK